MSVYSVTEIPGKGLGCVATTDIKRGTLILSEKVSLYHEGSNINAAYLDGLYRGYSTMSSEDKTKYLSLANCFSEGCFSVRLDLKIRAGFAFWQNPAPPKNAQARLDLGLDSGLNLQKLCWIWGKLGWIYYRKSSPN